MVQKGRYRRFLKQCPFMGLVLAFFCLCSIPLRAATVSLAWDAPINCTDGGALTDLAGYRLYYGTESGVYGDHVDVTNGTSTTVSNLPSGRTYYFAVTAISSSGGESDRSNELELYLPPAMVVSSGASSLPAVWKVARFGGSDLAAAEASADPDHDGVSNYAEYIAGTDPLDPGSRPHVEIAIRNGRPEVSFLALEATGAGYAEKIRSYTLQQCTNLSSGVWTPVAAATDVLALGQTVTQAVDAAQYEWCFYRVTIDLK